MQVYTVQLAQHRLAKAKDIPLVDITVKSGIRTFAPTWRMLTLYQAGTVDAEQYAELYRQKLNDEAWATESDWQWLLSHDRVALACYCRGDGRYCHRHTLVEILREIREKQNLPFEYCGELTPQ